MQFQCQKTVPVQTIQFIKRTQFSSIWPLDSTLSGATTVGQSEPWSDGNEGVLRIPQRSNITGASPSNSLVSYLGHSWGGGLPFCSEAIYSLNWLGLPSVLSESNWCNHTVVMTWLQFGRIPILSERSDFHMVDRLSIIMHNTTGIFLFIKMNTFLQNVSKAKIPIYRHLKEKTN